ncbi:hypothetical protein F2Q69_00040176 [Brassica cretica]|uniref:Uncharacterized protein n=1 Tax=Brassica cretica TaxID=69181 RepID=A0A8S9NBH9_BRACR|nr:hypothetical protein F2Q69_00040176 [Brassica cretica]
MFWHSDRYKDDLRYLKVWLENFYEEYVEIHIRCMRQLGLPVSDSTITCLQVKQMMGKLMMMVLHVGLCCTVGFTGAAKSRNGMHKPLDFYCKPFSVYMVPLKFPIDA